MEEITPTEPCHSVTAQPRTGCKLRAAGATHPGEVREANEDAFRIEAEIGLIVVADGVASTVGGGEAARLVVNTVCDFLLSRMADPDFASSSHLAERTDAISVALAQAHERVRTEATRTNRPDMATTVAALWCTLDRAIVLHAGDSRVYRLRGRKLEALTLDHSLSAEYARRNGPVPAEVDRNYRHIITRSVSARSTRPNPEGRTFPLAPGDAFIVCTDGLTGAVPDDVIAFITSSTGEREGAETLISLACGAGGGDNITVAIGRWGAAFEGLKEVP